MAIDSATLGTSVIGSGKNNVSNSGLYWFNIFWMLADLLLPAFLAHSC